MRLIACGTAAGPMSAERAASGYLLQHGDHTIMLDCGSGSLRQAMRCGVWPDQIEAVVLSHLHLDHTLDLSTWAYMLRYYGFWPVPAIYGPHGTHELVERIATFTAPNERPSPFESVTEIEPEDVREFCGFTVRSVETPHSPNLRAYARRFEAGGRSLVFSGDTAPRHETVGKLAYSADVLLHECYSEEGMLAYAEMRPADQRERIREAFKNTHSEVGEVARIAREANAKRLVLTHLLSTEHADALLETASRIFPGEVIMAYDGLTLDI